MNKSQLKIFILPFATIVLLIVWLSVLYLPVIRNKKELEKKWELLQNQIRSEVPEARLESMKTFVDSLFAYIDVREEHFYPVERLLDLGRSIEQIGKQYGLTLVSVSPDYESLSLIQKAEEGVTELPLTLEFTGSFNQFAKFVESVPDFPYVIRVNEVFLDRESKDSLVLTVIIKGVIVLRKESADEDAVKNKEEVHNKA
jgi:Tfp pilus assembly protein PilO